MDRDIEGRPSADYLWQVKEVVPFLKIDNALGSARHGMAVAADRHFASLFPLKRRGKMPLPCPPTAPPRFNGAPWGGGFRVVAQGGGEPVPVTTANGISSFATDAGQTYRLERVD